jgi:hypothetical protein
MNALQETSANIRAKVYIIEDEMRNHAPVELNYRHFFSDGLYAREMTIPADTVLTGKIHKYRQLNILSKGEISVLTEEGVKRICAPFTIVSPPGTKRIAYAHTECVWTTIHGTQETDIDTIEKIFTADNEQEYLEHCQLLNIEGDKPWLGAQ